VAFSKSLLCALPHTGPWNVFPGASTAKHPCEKTAPRLHLLYPRRAYSLPSTFYPMPPKKLAPPPAALPALRTIRQRPMRVAPLVVTELQWYACPASGAFAHLLLLDGPTLLGHWVLPAVPPTDHSAPLRTGMWLQVSASAEVPTPSPSAAVQQGTCCVLGHAPHEPALPTGKLLLHLPSATGAAETYALTQLRSDGAGWLLSRVAPPTRG
jgi:hypothetical protein